MIRTLWRLLYGEPDASTEDAVMRYLRTEIRPVGPYCPVNPARNYNVQRRKRPQIEHTIVRMRRA